MTPLNVRMPTVFCFVTVLFLFSISMCSAQSSFGVEKECNKQEAKLGRDSAIRYWTEPANAGDAKAQFCLGIAIRPSGMWIGPKPDEKQMAQDARIAVKWIHRSAEQGFAPAQETLAHAYARGSATIDGVSKDLEKARYWMEKAANQGSPFANVFLGQWYRDGTGTLPVDKQRAYRYIRLAVKLLKAQNNPSKFRLMMEFFGMEYAVEDLAHDLTAKDRAKADSWVESQLQKFTKP